MVRHFNPLYRIIGASIALLFLSGCLPESRDVSRHREKMSASLIRQYARTAIQYATVSQNAVLRSGDWEERTLVNGRLADIGIALPSNVHADYLDSGFCKWPSAGSGITEYVFTWFILNAGGEITMRSVGTNQTGLISGELAKLMPGGNFGVMGPGSVIEVSGFYTDVPGGTITVPPACRLSIPEGSPVIFLQAPERQPPADYDMYEEFFEIDNSLRFYHNFRYFKSESGTDISTGGSDRDFF